MQNLKNTLRRWAEDNIKRDSSSANTLSEKRRNISQQALECFNSIPDKQFDTKADLGMFGEKISLWREMGKPGFVLRQRPEACACISGRFRCDMNLPDVFQVMLYNGFLHQTTPGQNLLYPKHKAELSDRPCICRLSDLEDDANNLNKLQAFFDEAQAGLCQKEQERKVKDTADFAKGGRDTRMEQIKWLNRALSEDCLIIYMPEGSHLEKPLQIINFSHSDHPAFVQTQCWVLIEKNAELSLVQCTDSNPHSEVLANSLTEIRLQPGARMEYIQLQNLGNQCQIFNTLNAQLEQNARLDSYHLTLNGGMTQNNIEVNLNQSEAHAEILGLYLQDRQQMVSNQVKVNHYAPRTYSRELFKGVIDDSALAFFKGHVFVSPEAEQTEAYQTNRNLLISAKAQAHAKPYLEIYADDVQCNHGVTVGQLDENALFYMRSRGIPATSARRLLMRAYADEILHPISVESIREWMSYLVKKRFSGQLEACQECVLDCSENNCL